MWYCYKDIVCKSCKKTFKYSHDTITLAIGEVECPHCKTTNSLTEIIKKERDNSKQIISKSNKEDKLYNQESKDDELSKVLKAMQTGHKIEEIVCVSLFSDEVATKMKERIEAIENINNNQSETHTTYQS